MNLEAQIEAMLFYKNEPVKLKFLAEVLKTSEENIKSGINILSNKLQDRGVSLVISDTEVALSTSPTMNELIDRIAREELQRDIGKAGLETLATVLYNGPISRREIDYIRGVNSTFILRSLMARGLVERAENKSDLRLPLYKPTLSLFAFLGIVENSKLPEYNNIREKVKQVINHASQAEEVQIDE